MMRDNCHVSQWQMSRSLVTTVTSLVTTVTLPLQLKENEGKTLLFLG